MFIVPMTRDASPLDRFFAQAGSARTPALDVAESDRAYTVTLDVPGVAKEDLQISVEGRRVTLRTQPAQAAAAAAAPQVSAADADSAQPAAPAERIVYRERSATRYARSFTLPAEVDQAEAGARLEQGVLTLTLPKRNARVATRITIN